MAPFFSKLIIKGGLFFFAPKYITEVRIINFCPKMPKKKVLPRILSRMVINGVICNPKKQFLAFFTTFFHFYRLLLMTLFEEPIECNIV